MKKIYYIVVALLSIVSCKGTGEINIEEITCLGDTLTVNESSPILSKIKIETLNNEPFCSELRTVGTVQTENGNYAEVGVPFDGRITTSEVMLGSDVKKGETLFEVSSPEFFEASKIYFQNIKIYETAKASYERKKALQEAGIISVKELEEACAEAENAYQEKMASEAEFKAYGMDPAVMKPGQAMKIVSPISGEIVRYCVTPGAYIKADGESVITVANLKKVWITAQVKERFIGSVSKGGQVEIFTESNPDEPLLGEVLNIGNLVDDQTRSVQVIVACDNSDLRLKYGMFVSVHFISESEEAIVVPSTAVFQGEETSYVYMASEHDNVFIRRQVIVGESNDDNTEIRIIEGLCSGDIIVSEGGLYLNN